MLQQYLPFTVLKPCCCIPYHTPAGTVATVLTVYGIETAEASVVVFSSTTGVATVLTVYGIETTKNIKYTVRTLYVATVLTVYGIETSLNSTDILNLCSSCNSTYRLRY